MLFLRIFKHLLPDAKAWRITVDKRLRQFFSGLTGIGDDVKTFFDLIFSDIDPQQTRQLELWENQFALPNTNIIESERRSRLDAAWKATGGQSPRYIQDTLQNAGFDVYVYEWWVPGSEAAVNVKACATPRDPNSVLNVSAGTIVYLTECGEPNAECGEAFMEAGNFVTQFGYLLVNKLFITTRDFITLCGEPFMECGEPQAECGDFLTYINIPIVYPIPTDPACWPYIVYIGGSTFGAPAVINENRRDEFEDLCLKIVPAQQWIGIIAEYVPVSTVFYDLQEDGDTLTGTIVKAVLTQNYGLTVGDFGGSTYGYRLSPLVGGLNPDNVFWLPPDTPQITVISVSNIDIVTLTDNPTTFDNRQSRIYVTIPGFSSTPIQLDIGGAPYQNWTSTGVVAAKPTGLNAYLLTQIGNTIPVDISVLGDISLLADNEHYFRADQITGSNIRGFDTAASQGTGEFGPGYLARMELFNDPTRLVVQMRITTAGLFVINLSNETGLTNGVSNITFEIEGFNWGSPITMTWNTVDFRAVSPATDGLSAYFISIFGQTKKVRLVFTP